MPVTFELFGKSVSLYYTFWLLGVLAVLFLGYYLGRRFQFGFSKSILYIVGTVLLGYALMWGTSWVFEGGTASGLNFIRIIVFLPIAVFVLAQTLGDSYAVVSDFIAPMVPMIHGVGHIGCIFPGCCHGYPSDWGLYSNSAQTICFPIQLVEAITNICISIILFVLASKGFQKGKLFAWQLVSFGGSRFLLEFLRDNEKIWNGISELAFHALVATIVGIILIAFDVLRKKEVFNRERNEN